MDFIENIKKCTKCNEEKELSQFYSQEKVNSKGEKYIYYRPDCIECTKINSTKWRYKNPDKFHKIYLRKNKKERDRKASTERNKRWRNKGGQRDWYQNNKDKLKIYQSKHRVHNISDAEWENCKNYFNYRCAYCGLLIENHFNRFKGKLIWTDFHQEHVDHDGENNLSNCVPSCKTCNSSKHTYKLEDWYNKTNKHFSQDRLNKIQNWLEIDHKKFIENKSK